MKLSLTKAQGFLLDSTRTELKIYNLLNVSATSLKALKHLL